MDINYLGWFFNKWFDVRAVENNRCFIENEFNVYNKTDEPVNKDFILCLDVFLKTLQKANEDRQGQSFSDKDVSSILNSVPSMTVLDRAALRKLLVAIIFELFDSVKCVYAPSDIDFENDIQPDEHVLDPSLFDILQVETKIDEFTTEIIYNLVAKDQTNPPKIPPGSFRMIKNPHDIPVVRYTTSARVILDEVTQIPITYTFQDEEGHEQTESGMLDIADMSNYQPTSLIDADYQDQYNFTIRNNSDDEGMIKSIGVRAIIQLPRPQLLEQMSFRLPIIKCTTCHPIVSNEQTFVVNGVRRATERAGAFDIIGQPFDIMPRGTATFYLCEFFMHREYENSPNQFILRSRFSRNGLTLSVITDTENDESKIKLLFQNMTDKVMRIPDRVIQYLPTPYTPLNESLVSCEEHSHFCQLKTVARKNKY